MPGDSDLLGETLKRLLPLLNLGLQSSDISVLRSDAELFDSEGCEPRLANSLRLLFSLSGPDDSGTCVVAEPRRAVNLRQETEVLEGSSRRILG